MPRRILAFVVFAFAAAALFVRLGFWQLHRRKERRAQNAVIEARRALPAADAFTLARDSANAPFRRAFAHGTLDDAHELVLTSRTNDGSPGVWILTPLRVPGRDTALLVLRGWAYSPDAATVDLTRWREVDSAFTGYLAPFTERAKRATVPAEVSGRALRRLERGAVARLMPYPIAPVYLVAGEDSARRVPTGAANTTPRLVRISFPAIDDGPHLSYAIQWFAFGFIAVIGALAVALKDRGVARS